MKTHKLIKIVLNKLKEKKAQNIKAFNVSALTNLYDYIIIASSSNSTHVKSLTDDVVEVLKINNKKIDNIEKDNNFKWIVLDCEDFIVNIFHNKEREFYNLEDLWSDAKPFIT